SQNLVLVLCGNGWIPSFVRIPRPGKFRFIACSVDHIQPVCAYSFGPWIPVESAATINEPIRKIIEMGLKRKPSRLAGGLCFRCLHIGYNPIICFCVYGKNEDRVFPDRRSSHSVCVPED